jgi:hypothetical protein
MAWVFSLDFPESEALVIEIRHCGIKKIIMTPTIGT